MLGHKQESFGPDAMVGPVDGAADLAAAFVARGEGCLVSFAYSGDRDRVARFASSAAAWAGRLYLGSAKMAAQRLAPAPPCPRSSTAARPRRRRQGARRRARPYLAWRGRFAGEGQEFIFELTDEAKIAHARKVLAGEEQEKVHVAGRIVKRPQPYNPGWSFHLAPTTIDFFEMAIEVCDANMSYVEDHLDEVCGAFLPGCMWCPWDSRLVREIGPA